MADKKITIYDVAKKAGVSNTTVSRVLNNPEKVRIKTKNKVLRIIEELGFYPNLIARGLAAKKTTTIGVVVPDLSRKIVAELVNGILDVCETYKYSLKIYSVLKDKDIFDKTKQIISDQVDGLIFANEELSERSIAFLKNKLSENIPLVFANVSPQSETLSNVHIDYIKAVYDLTTEFIRKGKKEIYFATSKKELALYKYMQRGYIKAMDEGELEERIFQTDPNPLISKEDINQYFEDKKVEVLIASNEEIAVSFMNEMIKKGYKIPDDIEVAACQNTILSLLARPTLTAIDQPAYDIGAVSMRILIKIMDEKSEMHKQILNFSIIKRESTKI